MDIVSYVLASKNTGDKVSFESLTDAQIAQLCGKDGTDGTDGTDGVGVSAISLSGNTLTFTMTDNSIKTVTVPNQIYYSTTQPENMPDGSIWIKKETE